jgi:Do/DeqQ family serine protease
MVALFAFLGALVLVAAPAAAETRTLPTSREFIHLSFAPVVKKAAPAVVNVYSRRVVRNQSPLFSDPLFRRFFNNMPRERVESALGSGVILDADGLIVTNHHVIEAAQEITVVLSDRREFEAKVLLSDERVDLAVLKIEVGERLPVLEMGDSDQLEVGDLVLAIGNPFGVGQTVTSGIVSGLARSAVGISDMGSFIQTDAPINPGNSGGALVDLDGRLVGINTAIFSRSGGSIGIGFAIPTTLVRLVLDAARHGGRFQRPWLGASGQAVTAEIATNLGLPRPGGVIVKDVAPGSPAARAGIKIGDVILAVDGHEVEDPGGLRYRVATAPLNSTAQITVWNHGRERSIAATLTLPPEVPPRDLTDLTGRQPFAGATVGNLNPAYAEELGVDPTLRGVVVAAVKDGSNADRIGLQPGDILVSINRRQIESIAQLQEAIAATRAPWTLVWRRNGQQVTAQVR